MVGHRRLITLLSQAIHRGTLPPTLLFAGPAGTGKFGVAQAVAATLNCLSPVSSQPGLPVDACGTCRACDRVARGVHVEVLALEPDERASIKTDVVRDVLSRTGFRPFEGRRRVVIIREAETLESQAQNALLKSLEEPPPGTVFILVTTVPDALLPTVRSRCMRLRFGRLTEAEIEAVLTRDFDRRSADARAAATLADGSVAQALALESADLVVLRETATRLLTGAAARSVSQRLQAAGLLVSSPSKKDRTRDELGLVLRFLASMLRDLELLNTGGDERIMANPALRDQLQGLQRAFEGPRAREAFQAVDRALMALERNAGQKLVSEWLAMHI